MSAKNGNQGLTATRKIRAQRVLDACIEALENRTLLSTSFDGINAASGHAPFVSEHGQSVLVPASQGLLTLAHDPNGLSLTAELASDGAPAHGSVTISPDGAWTYTPTPATAETPGFIGIDTFDYTVTDSASLTSNPATVAIDCYSPMPWANNAAFVANRAGVVTASATGVLSLAQVAYNPAGGNLTFQTVSGEGPQHGSLTLNADGSFTYTANSGYAGIDHFQYVINDGYNQSNVANVLIEPSFASGFSTSAPDPAYAPMNATFEAAENEEAALPSTAVENVTPGYSKWVVQVGAAGLAVRNYIATDWSSGDSFNVNAMKSVEAAESAMENVAFPMVNLVADINANGGVAGAANANNAPPLGMHWDVSDFLSKYPNKPVELPAAYGPGGGATQQAEIKELAEISQVDLRR